MNMGGGGPPGPPPKGLLPLPPKGSKRSKSGGPLGGRRGAPGAAPGGANGSNLAPGGTEPL